MKFFSLLLTGALKKRMIIFQNEYLLYIRKFRNIMLLCVQDLVKRGENRGENFDSKRSYC